MKNQQTIMCDVKACKYHNGDNCCCNLSKITVTPCEDCETAHYCGNYVTYIKRQILSIPAIMKYCVYYVAAFLLDTKPAKI